MPTGGNSCQRAKVEESSELYKSIMVHKRKRNGVNPFSQHFLVSKALVKPVEKKIWKRNPHHILVRTRSNKLCSFYVSIYQISTYRTICLSVSTRISCFCFAATSSEDFHLLCRIATTKVGKIRLTAKLFRRNLTDSSNFFPSLDRKTCCFDRKTWRRVFWQEDRKTGSWIKNMCFMSSCLKKACTSCLKYMSSCPPCKYRTKSKNMLQNKNQF